MTQTTAQQAIIRFSENEQRVDTFVNTMESYTTNTAPPRTVQSLPAFMAELQGRMLVVQYRGEWTPDTAYDQNNVVRRPDNDFIATIPHTSGSDFDADLAGGKWVVYGMNVVEPASETLAGSIYAASAAEAAAGRTDASRAEFRAAVTPEGLAAALSAAAPPDADTTRKGLVELATVAETTAGTSIALATTPAGVKAARDVALGPLSNSLGNHETRIAFLENNRTLGPRGRVYIYTGSSTFTAPENGLCIGYVVAGGAPGAKGSGSWGHGFGGKAGEIVHFSQYVHAGGQYQVVVGGQSGHSLFDYVCAMGSSTATHEGNGGLSRYGFDGATSGGVNNAGYGGEGGFHMLPARLGYTTGAGHNNNGAGGGLGWGAGGAGAGVNGNVGYGAQGLVLFWFLPITQI